MWYYVYPPTEEVMKLPLYLISIGLHELQPYIVRPDGHDYDQFFYNRHGAGVLVMNNVTYNLPEGSAFFIPAGIPHKYYPLGRVWDVRWMVPSGYVLKDIYRQLHIERGGAYKLIDSAPLDIILNRMHDELIRDKVRGNYFASGCIYEFIMEFARQTGVLVPGKAQTEDMDTYSVYMEQLRDYIDYHFMHHITLQELCSLIAVTPQHLCRIFKKCTGQRPMEYITQRRIRAAKELLHNTKHTVNDICVWSGFENLNYFYKCFKALEKMTPGEFRQQNVTSEAFAARSE